MPHHKIPGCEQSFHRNAMLPTSGDDIIDKTLYKQKHTEITDKSIFKNTMSQQQPSSH
jgi:hypothetical protein